MGFRWTFGTNFADLLFHSLSLISFHVSVFDCWPCSSGPCWPCAWGRPIRILVQSCSRLGPKLVVVTFVALLALQLDRWLLQYFRIVLRMSQLKTASLYLFASLSFHIWVTVFFSTFGVRSSYLLARFHLLIIMATSRGSYYTQLVGLSFLLFLYACVGFGLHWSVGFGMHWSARFGLHWITIKIFRRGVK